ncbi:MAG: asparagine synthetase B [Candidatus Marinimicrobia bacterium]|nr:asparagine synthetase B [Candidatus Neomarinimicrobiota bacterium]
MPKLKKILLVILILLSIHISFAAKVLIPMDRSQTDHLKAYGVVYWILKQGQNVEWLLNYRGGSFMTDTRPAIIEEMRLRGVNFERPGNSSVMQIYSTIDKNNMDIALLEKAAKIAIYTPPNTQPWDDAVTMALTYAEIDYDKVWDKEVLNEKLNEYDWLHLHHEDFTGQYGKFYANYRNHKWYKDQKQQYEALARELGFESVSQQKKAVAAKIKKFVNEGGFLFAMCAATDALDIALASQGVDIVASPFDGDPPEPNLQKKLNYSNTLAFKDFKLYTSPMVYEFSDIDYPPSNNPVARGAMADYFNLFQFSAKYDPVPTMLTQNHQNIVKGFMGQTTGFLRSKIKESVVVLGEVKDGKQVKYLHGNQGQGTFTFLGGHDPEDYKHYVGDPKTRLELHKHSPGYRLILNNVLFPSAKKKKRKT